MVGGGPSPVNEIERVKHPVTDPGPRRLDDAATLQWYEQEGREWLACWTTCSDDSRGGRRS